MTRQKIKKDIEKLKTAVRQLDLIDRPNSPIKHTTQQQ